MPWLTIAKLLVVGFANGLVSVGVRNYANKKFEVEFDVDDDGKVINPKTGLAFENALDERKYIDKKYAERDAKRTTLTTAATVFTSSLSTAVIIGTEPSSTPDTQQPNTDELV